MKDGCVLLRSAVAGLLFVLLWAEPSHAASPTQDRMIATRGSNVPSGVRLLPFIDLLLGFAHTSPQKGSEYLREVHGIHVSPDEVRMLSLIYGDTPSRLGDQLGRDIAALIASGASSPEAGDHLLREAGRQASDEMGRAFGEWLIYMRKRGHDIEGVVRPMVELEGPASMSGQWLVPGEVLERAERLQQRLAEGVGLVPITRRQQLSPEAERFATAGIPAVFFHPRGSDPQPAKPMWVSAAAATNAFGSVDWPLLSWEARSLFDMANLPPASGIVRLPDGTLHPVDHWGRTADCVHYGPVRSHLVAPRPTATIPRFAAAADTVAHGVVAATGAGFLAGRPITLLKVRLSEVLVSTRKLGTGDFLLLAYPAVRFMIGETSFCSSDPRLSGFAPREGDEVLAFAFGPPAEMLDRHWLSPGEYLISGGEGRTGRVFVSRVEGGRVPPGMLDLPLPEILKELRASGPE
jgi:hypothetical protein